MKGRVDIVIAVLALIVMGACASIGRPEGGPRDETPPRYVRANPEPGTVNVSPTRLEVWFDENIKLEDPSNKIIVSPVMTTPPRAMANGHRLVVNFSDTLKENATYTIDFGDAIRDLNEGNVLEGFAVDFSTGPTRDSLVIAGKVFAASNLEPAQSMLVGVHSDLSDSAVINRPFDRVARTGQRGEFVIRNLAEGRYRVYAINDVNRNNRWDENEDIAFYDSIVVPTAHPIMVADTLSDVEGRDSIVNRQGTQYLPNDLLLTWFNEERKSSYLKNYQRSDSNRITLEMGAPSDSLPVLTVLNGENAGRLLDQMGVMNYNGNRDSIEYWITEPTLMSQDTIIAATRYRRTDSLKQTVWATDTLKFTFRRKAVKPSKKNVEKKVVKDSVADSIANEPERRYITFEPSVRGAHELNRPLTFKASEPIAWIDPEGVRIEMEVDSVWRPIEGVELKRDSVGRLLDYSLHYRWEGGGHYRFVADSAAIVGIYGDHIKGINREFNVKSEEEYSTVKFEMGGLPADVPVVVELLSTKDEAVKSVTVSGNMAMFDYVDPGTYYARAYIDPNGNERWDRGSLLEHRQGEEVYYYPKKLNVKKNWDLSQEWDINETPIDQQKPLEITTNKPKLKANETEPTTTDDEEEYEGEIDPFTGRPYGSDAYGRSHGRSQTGNQRLTGGTRVQGTVTR